VRFMSLKTLVPGGWKWFLALILDVFVKGAARENRPPRGVDESMLIFRRAEFVQGEELRGTIVS
jgi:hypothetical protein